MALHLRRRRTARALGVAVGLLAAPLCYLVTAASAHPVDAQLSRQVAEVRQATARYHDLDVAVADGYIPFGSAHCVEAPGAGVMGFHYYNPTLLFDGVLDPTKPELLLYAPSGRGERLVGVEYMMPLSTWSGVEAPDLFGQPFDGPMPEHDPDTTGVHYDQHFWIWSHNPSGLLATWNPSISC